MQTKPGDIDWNFTESVNQKHRFARFLDAAVPVSLLLGAMAIGWFAHQLWNN